jgi:alanine racemase
LTCCAAALYLKTDIEKLQERMKVLQPVNMRLEFKKGINNCIIINDSYSADVDSFAIALHFLQQQAKGLKKTVILSDFVQAGNDSDSLYRDILEQLQKHKISRLIAIGGNLQASMPALMAEKNSKIAATFYKDARELIQHFSTFNFKEEAILIKGARIFKFEDIAALLEQKVHQTILEINLNAIAHNFKTFQQMLKRDTKIMVMVKAFAYGSGGTEVASLLQYHKADYLGVAYADEGVEIRKAGITTPVMVLNPEENAFEAITENMLEPDVFSFEQLDAFEKHVQQNGLKNYPVHIEIETGMNRLGFNPADIPQLIKRLKNNKFLKVVSVFSHLAASEDEVEDAFTLHQYELLVKAAAALKKGIGYDFLKHIANSSAIARFPSLQLDMVRLGIGLYGIGGKQIEGKLQPALSLKSTIAQLKRIKKGETVSYNRRGVAAQDSLIATVRIGYADGYSRRLSNGVGYMLVKGQKAPVIGTVCMDMVMIDVTQIKGVKEGDEVIVFGNDLPVEVLAQSVGTIPYEIMTGISQRVKRVYWSE